VDISQVNRCVRRVFCWKDLTRDYPGIHNRDNTDWSSVPSVIIRVILLTERIGRNEVLLPIYHVCDEIWGKIVVRFDFLVKEQTTGSSLGGEFHI